MLAIQAIWTSQEIFEFWMYKWTVVCVKNKSVKDKYQDVRICLQLFNTMITQPQETESFKMEVEGLKCKVAC